jgi:DNA polymerase-3 subunit epsilon
MVRVMPRGAGVPTDAGPVDAAIPVDAAHGGTWHGLVASTRFAVIDVETSGLRPDRHRLLQIGIVRTMGDGTEIDRWDTLLRAPWRPVGGRKIHGLSRRALRGAPRLRQVAGELAGVLEGSVVCAHNIEFDWPFLAASLQRAGRPPPDAQRLCTLALSRSLDPERTRSHRLSDLCRHYGVPLTRAHDASADAAATAALLPLLMTDAGITDLGQLTAFGAGRTTGWITAQT